MKRLMLVCFVLMCLWGTAQAAEYTVDPAGNGDFPSLTAALAAVQDGDALVMMGGTYDESVETFPILVEKAVEIRAAAGEKPLISSPRLVPAMELNADGIRVSGLDIVFLRSGMWVAGAVCMTLTNCAFSGCGVALAGPPISASSKGLPALTGMFEVGEDAAFFTTHTMTDNLVNGLPLAYVVDLDDAVYSEPCGQLLAVGCDGTTFTGLACNRASMGIEVAYCTDTVVESCTADDSGIFGIYVAKSDDCVIRACRADRSTHGIDLRAIHRCVVECCSSAGSGQGMFFSMAFDSLLVDCDIVENGTGFFAAAGDRNHMDNCRVTGNQLGTYIQKEPNFTLTNCTFRANWNTGARSTLAPGYAIIGCTFEDNWVAAMSDYSEGVFYYGNSFSASQSCSLYMKGNTLVRMLNNAFTEADAALCEIIECPDVLRWPE